MVGAPPVIVFVILGQVPVILLLAQLGMLYLVVVDLREERDVDFQVKLWWFLAVLLFNVIGFLGAKLWLVSRRRRRRREAEAEAATEKRPRGPRVRL